MRDLKPIPTKPCVCTKTGKEIDCKDCVQPIVDQDYNKRGCNMVPVSIESELERKRKKTKYDGKNRPMLESINCSCGNVIKQFNKRKFGDQVKCFKCNIYWEKQADETWEKISAQPITRDTLTIGDILKKKVESEAEDAEMV